jgi:energy-coupling factor transporter ATP-binding protein EcfA2
MDGIEKLQSLDREFLPSFEELSPTNSGITRHVRILRREIVARALKRLWKELELDGEPLIFESPASGQMHTEHHPLLLDQLVAGGKRRRKERFGQLVQWKQLDAPPYACDIAATPEVGVLLKADMLQYAEAGDRGTIPSPSQGWLCYTFARGWTALSVYFYEVYSDEQSGPLAMAAIPAGSQDEWLAFLALLEDLRNAIARRQRRGRIEIIGGDEEMVEVIKKASFQDVVLPEETLAQVAAQRRIFDAAMLHRYAALRVPRLRKVLLVGPPGTGKTTLLKAEGGLHAKKGGLVFYVCAPPRNRSTTSWQQLSYALSAAAACCLPTLVLVEDFEMFVSDPQELQLVLNTLDGVATPDNPAGTLLLATTNDPEQIDQRIRDRPGRVDMLIEIGLVEETELGVRFLKHFLGASYREEHAAIVPLLLNQPGSHFREVCIAGAMRALEQNRTDVLYDDLRWAHETILNGRAVAADAERFLPRSARKRGGFFGKNR